MKFILVFMMFQNLNAAVGVREGVKLTYQTKNLKTKYGHDDLGSLEDANQYSNSLACPDQSCPVRNPGLSQPMQNNLKDVGIISQALLREKFDAFSNSETTQRLIQAARDNLQTNDYVEMVYDKKTKKYKKHTHCYRAVKDALRGSGFLRPGEPFGGILAYNGVNELEAIGFKNLLDDPDYGPLIVNNPAMVPKGMILVYETASSAPARVSRAGHIEIKTADAGSEGYISVSEFAKPTYGYPIPTIRRLIGAMYKSL